jgi:hypothetical protein
MAGLELNHHCKLVVFQMAVSRRIRSVAFPWFAKKICAFIRENIPGFTGI